MLDPTEIEGAAIRDLDRIGEAARGSLNDANTVREEALGISRELIRTSANSIRYTHRGDVSGARDLLHRACSLAAKLVDIEARRGEIFHTGYVQDGLKEYAEARCVFALVNGETVPDAACLGVPWPAFLNGLGEAIGELRRHCLDLLRSRDTERACAVLDDMDGIYTLLVTMDYPDALTGGLRRTTDMARGILERTRADLTTAVLQERLSGDISRLVAQLPANIHLDSASEEH